MLNIFRRFFGMLFIKERLQSVRNFLPSNNSKRVRKECKEIEDRAGQARTGQDREGNGRREVAGQGS